MGNIILFLDIAIPCLLIWATIRNAKAGLSGFVGIFSLMAIIPLVLLYESMAHINELSSSPSALIVLLVLIVCGIGYIVLFPLCISSVMKNCKSNFENHSRFTKMVFSFSIIVSVVTLITLIIGSCLEFRFGFNIAQVLFSSYSMFLLEVCSSLLVLGFAIWGLYAKWRKVKVSTTNTDKPIIKIPNISSDDIAKGAAYAQRGAETMKQNTTVLYDKTTTIYKGVFSRVKQMLLSPQSEYQAIEQEDRPHTKVLTSYVLPLLLIPALFAFIGYGLVGYSYGGYHFSDVGLGFRMAIVQIAVLLGGIYLSALIINVLADNFGATKNFNRTFSLVAYAYTPMLLAGIFHILHSLWWLVFLVGLYGLYLIFVGLKPMLKPTEEKEGTYYIISLAVIVVGYIILFQILKAIMLPNFFFH